MHVENHSWVVASNLWGACTCVAKSSIVLERKSRCHVCCSTLLKLYGWSCEVPKLQGCLTVPVANGIAVPLLQCWNPFSWHLYPLSLNQPALPWPDLKWAGWAHFASLPLAESMPEFWLKTKKPSNSQTVNPNLMCKDLLESYNPSPQVCKISSTPSTNCIQNTLPK
jgi:hypothetical protein